MIGKRLKNVRGSYKEENVTFLSSSSLLKWVETLLIESDDLKFDVLTLREFNKA